VGEVLEDSKGCQSFGETGQDGHLACLGQIKIGVMKKLFGESGDDVSNRA
jgi:hypothetical protein